MHGFRRFCSCSSSNMGRKVVDFEGSFLGRYFVTFFWGQPIGVCRKGAHFWVQNMDPIWAPKNKALNAVVSAFFPLTLERSQECCLNGGSTTVRQQKPHVNETRQPCRRTARKILSGNVFVAPKMGPIFRAGFGYLFCTVGASGQSAKLLPICHFPAASMRIIKE